MDGTPPPPPPHGSNPGTTNGSKNRKATDLPEGQYDIFVIPPHASGSGFLYLPSLQCHRNSFLAGVVSTLLVGGAWVVISPILKDWVSTIAASGYGGFILLVVGVGVAGWAWGKSQSEGGFGFGGPNSPGASGPPPGATPGAGSGPGAGQGAGGAGPNAGAQYPGGSNYGGQYAGGNQYSGAGGPNPGGQYRGRQYAADGDQADEGNNAPGDGAHTQQDKESQREREREEARRKEELRRKMEEMKKQREEEQSEKQKAREMEAREREARRQEALRKEREAKEAAKKDAGAKVTTEEAKKKEALERERAAKQNAEKEAAAKFAAARESAAAKFAAAKEAAARKAAEKEKAAKEAAAKEAREARFKEAKARREEREAAAKMNSPANGPRTPSPQKKPPYSSAKAADDAYSFRPYDKPRSAHPAATASSIFSESSYAYSQSTAQTTPPPSHRGPYSTKDPDKIIVKGVYSFNNTFMKIPIAQLISGQGSVTDGLILRITTEGLFIDDDVRSVPQREWDLKAWTLKLAEVWCSQYAASHSARPAPPKSNPFRRNAARTQPIPTSEESDACLVNLLKGCKDQCRLASVSSHRGSNIDGHDSQSGQMRGHHVLRVHIRDQEGKKFVFVLQETEGWKLALGLQRLRKGTQARSLGVCGMPSNETKALLDNLGMA